MRNDTRSSLNRRGFLGLGALTSVLGALGCDGGGTPEQVTTPPVENSARSRLKLIESKTEAAASKKGKK
jgi:hypothetical protein